MFAIVGVAWSIMFVVIGGVIVLCSILGVSNAGHTRLVGGLVAGILAIEPGFAALFKTSMGKGDVP